MQIIGYTTREISYTRVLLGIALNELRLCRHADNTSVTDVDYRKGVATTNDISKTTVNSVRDEVSVQQSMAETNFHVFEVFFVSFNSLFLGGKKKEN